MSATISVTDQSSTTADISAKALTATASASNKTYDGGTIATTTSNFYQGLLVQKL